MSYQPLQGVLTEAEVIKILGLSKSQLSVLRLQKQLPFIKLGDRYRLYFEKDLMEFFKSSRIILNKAPEDTIEA